MLAAKTLNVGKVYEGFVWVFNRRGKSQFLASGTWDGKLFTVTTTTGKERTVQADYYWDATGRRPKFEPHYVTS